MFQIVNELGESIQIHSIEVSEQKLVKQYIKHTDCVLELGARFGLISCLINQILDSKKNQVSVEPDARVWDALEKNKLYNECEFWIVKGTISSVPMALKNLQGANGYATQSYPDPASNIPFFSLQEIREKTGIERFSVLFVDCEGCMEQFLSENEYLLNEVRLVLFEKDNPRACNYTKIRELLISYAFTEIHCGFHNVWSKDQ
jgi:FkbM family methyltransferase